MLHISTNPIEGYTLTCIEKGDGHLYFTLSTDTMLIPRPLAIPSNYTARYTLSEELRTREMAATFLEAMEPDDKNGIQFYSNIISKLYNELETQLNHNTSSVVKHSTSNQRTTEYGTFIID